MSRQPVRRGARRCGEACAALAAALAVAAGAHVELVSPTLSERIAGATLVAHARILDSAVPLVPEPTPVQRSGVEAELREVLRGPLAPGARVRFAQHGHARAQFAAGESVLLFLDPLGAVPELARTPLADHVAWVSRQEYDARWSLDESSRRPVLAAARQWLAALREANPDARLRALGATAVEQVGSADPRVARDALQDLVRGALPLPADGAARLLAFADAPKRPLPLRAAVLAELARRGVSGTEERFARLVREAPAGERVAAVRAAGANPSEPVQAALVRLLAGADAPLAAEAAIALGAPGRDAALPPLETALSDPRPSVRAAAVRGLARIGTPEARAALQRAAAGHPDPALRRRAAAELRPRAARPAAGAGARAPR